MYYTPNLSWELHIVAPFFVVRLFVIRRQALMPKSFKSVSLQEFRKRPCEPLNTTLNIRLQKRLSMYLKAHALSEGVGESTVIRFALERFAREQGWSDSCL